AASMGAASRAGADNPVPLEYGSAANLPVGTTILFAVNAPDTNPKTLYRFSVAPPGGAFAVQRDFNVRKGFDWTPIDDGLFNVKVTAKTPDGQLLESQLPYVVASRVVNTPVVSA